MTDVKWMKTKDRVPHKKQNVIGLYFDKKIPSDSDVCIVYRVTDRRGRRISWCTPKDYGEGHFVDTPDYWTKIPTFKRKKRSKKITEKRDRFNLMDIR